MKGEFGRAFFIKCEKVIDFFWDEVSAGGIGIGYDIYLDLLKLTGAFLGQEPTEILWTLIPLWGFVFLGVGLLGAVLVAIPAFQLMSGSDPMNTGFIGLIAGLVATVVEFALFAIVGILDTDLMGGGGDINFVLLGLFVVSWVALIIGYIFVKKE